MGKIAVTPQHASHQAPSTQQQLTIKPTGKTGLGKKVYAITLGAGLFANQAQAVLAYEKEQVGLSSATVILVGIALVATVISFACLYKQLNKKLKHITTGLNRLQAQLDANRRANETYRNIISEQLLINQQYKENQEQLFRRVAELEGSLGIFPSNRRSTSNLVGAVDGDSMYIDVDRAQSVASEKTILDRLYSTVTTPEPYHDIPSYLSLQPSLDGQPGTLPYKFNGVVPDIQVEPPKYTEGPTT